MYFSDFQRRSGLSREGWRSAPNANVTPRDFAKGLKNGFFRYLTKPIKVNQFMDTLDRALESSGKLIVDATL